MAQPASVANSATTDPNNTDQPLVNLEEDEEEERRLANIEQVFIPTSSWTQNNNKKGKQAVSAEQLERLRHLLNNRDAILPETEARKMKDIWSTTKQQRKALYRYWLCRYVENLKGIVDLEDHVTFNRRYSSKSP